MYQPTDRYASTRELVHLLAEALARVPTQCNGSFIVPFPFVPDSFGEDVVHQVRLVGLLPGQQIPLHVDAKADCPGVRYHVPLQTNRHALVFSENAQGVLHCQELEVRRAYQMDPTQPHGAVNWGDTLRLHLMIDVEG